ncbi:MAG: MFS transporter [Deltaproteobacteria bacterium]|nr:MFS transporter [Deltaproteobacteria bacterium]MBW2413258.1 MFS transporter [Deltaproteobacteria bacterium]
MTRAAEPARVEWRVLGAYAAPTLGLASPLFFVQFFFLKYATDVLLMAPAAVALIFGLSRLWDAVTDPVVGVWSDATRSRLGRRRPWMLAGTPVVLVGFVMIWVAPRGLGEVGLGLWVGAALVAFFTGFTAWIVPHMSLGAELSDGHHDRSRIFGTRQVFFMLGMFVAFGLIGYVTNSADQRVAAARAAIIVAVVCAGVLLVPPLVLRERPEYQGRGAERPFRAIADVFRNPHARIVLFVQFIDSLAAGILGVIAPYFAEYVLKRPDLIALLPACFVVSSVASVPVWVMISHRLGKKNTWLLSMVMTGLAFGSQIFVGENDVLLASLILVAAGVSFGAGGVLGPSILADVIDWDELQTGERKEGAYSAGWGFSFKAGAAAIVVFAGAVLQATGFEPNVDQAPPAHMAIRLLNSALPFGVFLLGALVFTRFRFDSAEHARVRAALAERREDRP